MKFIVSIVLIAFLSLTACFYLPWFAIAIVAFIVVALIPQKPVQAFFSGFIALFILWGVLCLYISYNNNNILAGKVGLLFFKTDNAFILILVTAFIGALVAGFGAVTASFLRNRQVAAV